MTLTVSVDATQRIARFEFSQPSQPQGMVYGYSEILMQQPDNPTKGAEFMIPRSPMMPAPKEGEPVSYGTMPGSQIARGIPDVIDQSVEVDGKPISLKTVLAAMDAFFEKWRMEDASKPPMMMASPPSPSPAQPPEQDRDT